MAEQLDYRDLSEAISGEIELIADFFDDSAKYGYIIRAFQEMKNQEGKRPTQKYLCDKFDMRRKRINTLLRELYEDFKWKLGEDEGYQIQETRVKLVAHIKDDLWEIDVNLQYIPRIGDTFFLHFVRGEPGGQVFKVKDIYHTVQQGMHEVRIIVWDYYALNDEKMQLYHDERNQVNLLNEVIEKIKNLQRSI